MNHSFLQSLFIRVLGIEYYLFNTSRARELHAGRVTVVVRLRNSGEGQSCSGSTELSGEKRKLTKRQESFRKHLRAPTFPRTPSSAILSLVPTDPGR